MTPFGGEDHEVEGDRPLDLDPAGAAAPRLVGSVERLHHHALVSARERVVEEAVGLLRVLGHDPRHAELLGESLVEGGEALRGRPVDQVLAVEMEDVEDERGQRVLGLELGEVLPAPAAEPAHRQAERVGSPVGPQRDRLGIEDRGLERDRADRGHDLGDAIGDVGEVPREDADLVAEPVDLDPGPVELPFDGGRADPLEGRRDVLRGLREHRLQRGEEREPEAARAPRRLPSMAAAAAAPRSPLSIAARRTSGSGTSAARETASTITPSRAPWRISPIRSPRRNACSSAVARANRSWSAVRRAAWEPAPASEPIRGSAASTSSSSSVAGAGAGGGRSFRDAHPTPIDPCGSTPER